MVLGNRKKAGSQADKHPQFNRVMTIIGAVFGLLFFALATLPPIIVPVFKLPKPTGPHAVGTQYFYLTDTDRPDEFTSTPDDFREISVQIWYPANLTGDEKRIPYMSKEAAKAFTTPDLPDFLMGHLTLVKTHAYLNAAISPEEAPYPVVTYSTSGLMSSHMSLFEEIASHGYVVVCIGHPYWNPFAYGANGEVITFENQAEYYEDWWNEANSPAVIEAQNEISLAKTTAAEEIAHSKHNEVMPIALADIRSWAEDIGFVLDQLEQMNQGKNSLENTLDLERVGVMGFSKGGAATGQFCVTDDRCKAGINFTGFMYGDILNLNLSVPFFFMNEEELWCPKCYVNNLFYQWAESDAYQMKIKGARHASFGDLGLFGFLFRMANGRADIEGNRMIYIQNVFTSAFFDRYLKGLPAPLLDDPTADFPELIFESRNTNP
jgi:predicted dienelactone hydrolase